jgi:hypothetical protein
MSAKNAKTNPASSSDSSPGPAYTLEENHWRNLRDALNHTPLDPSPRPSIFNGTPADFVPHITMAHTCGLTSGISSTPTIPNMIVLANTSAAQECQWMYYDQGLQYGILQRLQAISGSEASRPPPRQPAPKSRAPEPFDGTREKYSTFVLQLSLLFQNDPARYGSEGIQIRTAASYLSGGALGWFKAYHDETTQEIKFKTYTEFIQALKAAYDDPDKRATAERKLLALRQNHKDCSTYHAEFSTHANVLEYDDRTKISFFRKGANNDLQTALAHQLNPPDNFDKYVAMCIQLDNNIRNLKGLNTHRPPPMATATAPPIVPNTSSGTASGPMDLSTINRSKKRGPINEEEKKRRRDNNLCMYCGQSGHWATNCPHKRQRLNTASIDSAPSPIPVPASKPEVLYSVEAKNI